jgi:RNA polymerase sigma-70 factor, ECF subfamily
VTIGQPDLSRLRAARNGDQEQFTQLAEPYRRALRVYCYRLLGSLQDAEDVVQETMLRAWRRLETFEGRATFRAWLYKIATNACFDILEKRAKRGLPTQFPPSESSDSLWLDPFPDDWLDETAASAESRYTLHESVTLAFLTALQVLPPRQRAVLVLRDVLDWQASEVADFLEMTVSAVNSLLHRARSSLSGHYRITPLERIKTATDDAITRTLLERYVRAWEAADVTALVSLLKEDAIFSMPPWSAWFSSREAIASFFTATVFVEGMHCRLLPIAVSGQPGFAAYVHDDRTDHYRPHSIHVLTLEDGQIKNLTAFLDPALFPHFGLPDSR